VQTFNSNLKELGVIESKQNAIWRGFVHELLNAQATVLCSYFEKERVRKMTVAVKRARWKKSFKDWRDLNENWCKAVGRDMNRRTMVESASEQVDVRRWQPESSMEGSKWCRSLLAVTKN